MLEQLRHSEPLCGDKMQGDASSTLGRRDGFQRKFHNQIVYYADGLPEQEFGWYPMFWWANQADRTMGDCYQGVFIANAGNTSMFDFKRHNKRMNTLFIDGHVEGIEMTQAALSKVYITRSN